MKAALKGVPVKLSSTISGKTFSDWIASGALINTGTNSKVADIPVLSTFFLRMYISNGENTNICKVIAKLFDSHQFFDWHAFEQFHEYWESLIRYVYEGEEVTYNELYHLGKTQHSFPTFVAKPKEVRAVENLFKVVLLFSNNLQPDKAVLTDAFGAKIKNQYTRFVMVEPAGSEAIEACIFDELKDGGT